MLAKIFGSWPSLAYRRAMEAGAKLPEYTISNEIREMALDGMRHFIGSKKQTLACQGV